ncbi:hypothetical protein AMATHDRAFT_49213 [Amanita thiersii Skay4041]|uniref:RING-type domain-containing protein n=1 Tax=Amanita thiersii Skay4041 TaxID=703135 RepID=A0A2A9NM70_9AGAR|nr:hypothetical protein AMATHDRAFT_49213 [Amanita thiersii Skay4041]
MLTLQPGSACDVCAEEFGAHRLPHCIPCGHVLCAACCSTIVEKSPPRLAPVCPFCREQFTHESIRLIRMDFTATGWGTPRRLPVYEAPSDMHTDALARRAERLLLSDPHSKSRPDARRLEDKVVRVASKKTSVEEVSILQRELEDWLMSSDRGEHSQALYLSSVLLRAILMNHSAHSEACKSAKNVEITLKNKLDDLEDAKEKLEAELRRQRTLYAQKAQEYQNLLTEVNRLRALATTIPVSSTSEPRSASASPTPPSTPSPVPSQTYQTQPQTLATSSPVRATSMHSRSISMSARSTTPATPSRTYTPAPSQTLLARSQTPAVRSPQAPSLRSYTPAPPPAARMATPSPMLLRAQTPAPNMAHKARRLSISHHSSPQKMVRSTSEEKAEVIHERWIPPPDPDLLDHGTTSPTKMYTSYSKYISRPPSRMTTYSTLIQHREAKQLSTT